MRKINNYFSSLVKLFVRAHPKIARATKTRANFFKDVSRAVSRLGKINSYFSYKELFRP